MLLCNKNVIVNSRMASEDHTPLRVHTLPPTPPPPLGSPLDQRTITNQPDGLPSQTPLTGNPPSFKIFPIFAGIGPVSTGISRLSTGNVHGFHRNRINYRRNKIGYRRNKIIFRRKNLIRRRNYPDLPPEKSEFPPE